MQTVDLSFLFKLGQALRRVSFVACGVVLVLAVSERCSAVQFTNSQGAVIPSTLAPVRPMPTAPPPEIRANVANADTSAGGDPTTLAPSEPKSAPAASPPPSATAPTTPTPPPPAQPPVIPSLESNEASVKALAPRSLGNFQMPQNAGQQWVEYDIRPFTGNVKNVEKPQQWIVDWIIRETGTDVWFNEPMGVLNADSEKLRVFHTPEMQKRVAEIYEKFVNGAAEPQIYSVRIITINNPNWRSRALPLMRSVASNSPGVSAWLMPKENGAILLSQLRSRNDARELQAHDIPLYNGQLQYMEQIRSRNYLKEYIVNTTAPYPPYIPTSDAINEGFKLQISPLLSLDGKTADLMLKCEIDQVERLNPVRIDLPLNPAQVQSVQIEVPQVVSWRLQERFHWPTDQVLLLSCGIVANPVGEVNNTLLSNPPTFLGLNKVIPTVGQRNDAILWIEYKGAASNHLGGAAGTAAAPAPNNNAAPNTNAASVNPLSRGRY